MSNWIITNSGRRFDLVSFDEDQIQVEDIASALSKLCRFGGHTRKFYSVAQHSCLVYDNLSGKPIEVRKQGLLHDSPEAYLGDVVSPLKSLLPEYTAIEKRLEKAIFSKFGLPCELHPDVKAADLTALSTEARDLIPNLDLWDNVLAIPPWPDKIVPWSPETAEQQFLRRFASLNE